MLGLSSSLRASFLSFAYLKLLYSSYARTPTPFPYFPKMSFLKSSPILQSQGEIAIYAMVKSFPIAYNTSSERSAWMKSSALKTGLIPSRLLDTIHSFHAEKIAISVVLAKVCAVYPSRNRNYCRGFAILTGVQSSYYQWSRGVIVLEQMP